MPWCGPTLLSVWVFDGTGCFLVIDPKVLGQLEMPPRHASHLVPCGQSTPRVEIRGLPFVQGKATPPKYVRICSARFSLCGFPESHFADRAHASRALAARDSCRHRPRGPQVFDRLAAPRPSPVPEPAPCCAALASAPAAASPRRPGRRGRPGGQSVLLNSELNNFRVRGSSARIVARLNLSDAFKSSKVRVAGPMFHNTVEHWSES